MNCFRTTTPLNILYRSFSSGIKRFWKQVSILPEHDQKGYLVCLDQRPLKYQSGERMILPNLEMAFLLAAEWERVNKNRPQHLFPLVSYLSSSPPPLGK